MPACTADKRKLKARTMAAQKAYYEMKLADMQHERDEWQRRAVELMAQLMAALAERGEEPQP